MLDAPPVITFDGPSGSGKGTISQMLAEHLSWHWLESGSLYRAAAWAAIQNNLSPENLEGLVDMMSEIEIQIHPKTANAPAKISCNGQDVTEAIRSEECASMASRLAAIPVMRAALLQEQRDMLIPPGLICDGRDMGTVVFPQANLKFYLVASLAERARRRYEQLKAKGLDVNLRSIESDLQARDQRDRERRVSPAKPAEDAIIIDTTNMNIDEVMALVLSHVEKRFPKKR